MSFLTYAQNFEDVLLWRALGHVKNGFYIDVGANDPVEHSVTKAFYDAGWWGINIEPMPSYHAVFAAQRPRDINLTVAAGADSGHITLFEVPAMNGWASTDRAVAEAHRADGYDVVETDVPLRRLQDICAEHVRSDIHFLKIDVEGFEEAVLRGMDLRRWRPWVLVVEATLPGSRVSNHAAWEALVTDHGYQFAYFDGLNRYYVADEQAALREVLAVQANVFDDFISRHLSEAWVRLEQAGQRIQLVEEERRVAGIHLHEQEQLAAALRAQTDQAHQWTEQAHARAEQASAQAHLAGERAHQAEERAHQAGEWAAQCAAQAAEAATRAQHSDARTLEALLHAARIEQEHHAAAAAAEYLQIQLQAALAQQQSTQQWGDQLDQQLRAVFASSSWRWSKPLRLAGSATRVLRSPTGLRAWARRALRRVMVRITASQRLRRLILPHLSRFPALDDKVTALVAQMKSTPAPAEATEDVRQQLAAPHLQDVSAATRKVLRDLAKGPSHPSNPV